MCHTYKNFYFSEPIIYIKQIFEQKKLFYIMTLKSHDYNLNIYKIIYNKCKCLSASYLKFPCKNTLAKKLILLASQRNRAFITSFLSIWGPHQSLWGKCHISYGNFLYYNKLPQIDAIV